MVNLRHIQRMALFALVAALLGGCATGYSNHHRQPAVPPGSVIQVNSTFDIPHQKARVYLQAGRPVAWEQIDRWTTYCSIQVQHVQYADQPQQRIVPGRLKVIRVKESNDRYHRPRVFVVSRHSRILDIPSNVIYQVEMRLQSAEQPTLRALICAKRVDDIGFGRNHYPQLAEIRAALGELVEIEPPS